MSWQATSATLGLGGASGIFADLASELQTIDAKRRPDVRDAQLVAWLLADRHRASEDGSGSVNETVPQIAAALNRPLFVVRQALQALEDLNYWVAVRRGGRGRGTVREPTFLPDESRGADPAEIESESRGADPAQMGTELRGADPAENKSAGAELRGVNAELRGVDPATPRAIPVNQKGGVVLLTQQGTLLELADSRLHRPDEFADELPGHVEAWEAAFGPGVVRLVLESSTAKVRYPSDLRRLIERRAAEFAPVDPVAERNRRRANGTACPTCKDTGWASNTDDGDVCACPDCTPTAVSA